ncbi:leucyl-tRNA synthetase, mitochondrial [Zygosaccharomyces mellis]|uniref:leucine--tRNA ligase n=1 Tax=Zygosaccharomyces mellis TaxID=42258 RepID=A0A4C2E8T4_9SACH|nr:leucyl-tRNA synthetase, mitochondrial [Zygosaccharomyces mellis]
MKRFPIQFSGRYYSGSNICRAATVNLGQLGQKWKSKTARGIISLDDANDSVKSSKKNVYILSMFPYPSGALHMGHLRVYVISDSLNRFYKQNGYEVIHPMGWDAFGLPAENAAIDRGIDPSVWTKDNITKMKTQMNDMLANFDWDKEIATCDPEYYKYTQLIFLKLFEHGLAYRKEAEINWDPVDKTVLANEQVDTNGCSWRSGAVVEKRLLSQWFLGITKFAPELNHDLKYLKNWPSKVKTMQRNWIGESHGSEVVFKIDYENLREIAVFTTRAETVLGAQYLGLAIDHPLVRKYAFQDDSLREFITRVEKSSEDSKEGYLLQKIKAQNPITRCDLPVYVAPYVLGGYGYGAVMGCPAHDERDYVFWRENQPEAPVIPCVEPIDKGVGPFELPFIAKDALMSELTGEFRGMSARDARIKITEKLQRDKLGGQKTQYRLRDWLISRQRYWGAPIPIIHCDHCGTVPVPEKDLPVLLPTLTGLKSRGNPLSKISEFVDVNCPSCGEPAKRETDTMDTFMDSSWYYFRYLDSKNYQLPFNHEIASKNIPVDLYIGGVEHAILHLLYSRFIAKFLGSIGMWNGSEHQCEPFGKLVTQGMVHGQTYINPDNGKFLKNDELEITAEKKVVIKATGKQPKVSYEKMSKSKHNGVDPKECIEKYGPDATRAHILFQAPVGDILNWDETKIVGIERWIQKILNITTTLVSKGKYDENLKMPSDLTDNEIKFHNEIQKLLQNLTDSFKKNLTLNTVVSDYMKFTNALEVAIKKQLIGDVLALYNLKKLINVIYPVVPSISEEARELLNEGQGWHWKSCSWPEPEAQVESNTMDFQVIVNGKMKFMHNTRKDFLGIGSENVIAELLSLPQGKKHLANKDIKKVILKKNIISFITCK